MSCTKSSSLVGQLQDAAENGITSVMAQLLVIASAEDVNVQNSVSLFAFMPLFWMFLNFAGYIFKNRMAGLLLCLLVTEATLRLSNNFSTIPGLPSTWKAR